MSESTSPSLTRSSSETADLLLKVLRSLDGPRSLTQIVGELPKSARPAHDEARQVIAELVNSGQVHQYPPVRGQPMYWSEPHAAYAKIRLLRRVERGPSSESQILGDVSKLKPLQEVKRATLKQIFSQLLRDGHIHKLPPYLQARTPLYSTAPADPRDYVEDALNRLSAKLGVEKAQLIESYLPGPDHPDSRQSTEDQREPENRIVEAMRELDPRVGQGAMVSIPDLRNMLNAHLVGEAFDQALLAESAAGIVALHLFERPALVSEHERARMLRDENGDYYNAISLRNYER